MFLKNKNIIFKIRRSKVTDYAALNLHLKFGAILSKTYKEMTLYPHMYQNVHCNLLQKNLSIQELPLYKGL